MLSNFRNQILIYFFISIVTIANSTFCFAQYNYSEGYIIGNKNDTIAGRILDKDWERSPGEIQFKTAQSEVIENLKATDIKGFFINQTNRFYRSQNVTYNLYRKEVLEGESYVSKVITESIFMERLIRGDSIALYSLFDEKENQRFYLEKSDKWTELNYCKYYLVRNGRRYQMEQSGYQNQLKYLLSDCLKKRFDKLSYSEKIITDLIEEYIKCSSPGQLEKEIKENKNTFDLIVSAGIIYVPTYSSSQLFCGGLKINFPRKKRERYILIETGAILNWKGLDNGETHSYLYGSAVAGTYYGNKNVKPFLEGGILVAMDGTIVPIIGAGISYKKMLHFGLRDSLLWFLRFSF